MLSETANPKTDTRVNALHLAAWQGKADFLKAVKAALLNSESEQTNIDLVSFYFSMKDEEGNTVFHYAAKANKETIDVSRVAFIYFDTFLNIYTVCTKIIRTQALFPIRACV